MSGAITHCRACGGALSIPFCDLGEQPLANSYVAPADRDKPEPHFPLNVKVCEDCKLAQLDHVADSEAIFTHYAYLSSASKGWLAHAKRFCEAMTERLSLSQKSFVVEVASNDGYLLQNFVAAGIPCLGVEPAANVADIARGIGVPTKTAFFGQKTAETIRQEHGAASLICANNVMAHVPDINDFVAGFAALADDNTLISIECPHLGELIKNVQFDTIYHEHYAYWSLYAAERVLARHGLQIIDLERLPTHGGSLRFLAMKQGIKPVAPIVKAVRQEESDLGLDYPEGYEGFGPRVAAVLDAFHAYLGEAAKAGRIVCGYGAAAKGNTFLNALKARFPESDALATIRLVADVNSLKQNTLLPGSHIPVVSPAQMLAAKPDDIVILPWNIAPEVMASLKNDGFTGRFITAIPALRIT